MILSIETKFYAAHRNQHLNDKCFAVHGHRYGVVVDFEYKAGNAGGVTVLFSKLKEEVELLIKELDHSILADRKDHDLCDVLGNKAFSRYNTFGHATSAENICAYILNWIHGRGLPAVAVHLRETDTAVITMRLEDLNEWPK